MTNCEFLSSSVMKKFTRSVFVFGSNLAGIHGAGAAKSAVLEHGAEYEKNVTARWGVVGNNGVGLQGNSYAIPTKDEYLSSLPLERIEPFVKEFVVFAKAHPDWMFNVTRVGCGYAGNKPSDIAPMFAGAVGLENVSLPEDFLPFLSSHEILSSSVMKNFTLGVVGASGPNPASLNEFENAIHSVISDYLSKFGDGLTVVSGGAKGVDSMTVKVCGELGVKVVEFKPVFDQSMKDAGETRWFWYSGTRTRDLKIANESDHVVSIVNKSYSDRPSRTSPCYHCARVSKDSNHVVSGGCFTAINCKSSDVIVIEPIGI